MFVFRDSREGDASRTRVDVAFTDASLDLREQRPDAIAQVEAVAGVPFARLVQVHGDDVVLVTAPTGHDDVPTADAAVTTTPGLGLMVRVADCVPVLLADPDRGVLGAVHAGRSGMVLDVATRAVERMRDLGAEHLVGWVGPHVCGACYEVPEGMREEVAALVPEARAQTSWGTPALDVGAGVRAQLERAGVEVVEVGGCTREREDLHSYRRDGHRSGRFAGLVWAS
ncbi:polyphenol oxidase family protein [Nocardioides solisilvae]|uniref:polyphenol oxidase family protein n=1 Tax=Nocardioides solisilvae TaxID=1542435 RepID=UPI000D7420F6|nr:polyphenol oxidase family protein [Nocardioides solisilvae]